MCFSATACFTASAVLVPAGAYCLSVAAHTDRRYLALAAFPLFFGIQQALEGVVWRALEGAVSVEPLVPALGYTFFSHFLWLALVPFAAWRLGRDGGARRVLATFAVIGPLFGASLYLPLLLQQDWLAVHAEGGSIVYLARLIYEGILPRQGVRVIYALIIVIPLLLVPDRRVRVFAGAILISVVVSRILYDRAFVSVWCFFAALLSLYIVHVLHALRRESRPESSTPRTA